MPRDGESSSFATSMIALGALTSSVRRALSLVFRKKD